MNYLNFQYGINIPDSISDKIAGIFQSVSSLMESTAYLKDAFYANGFPVAPAPHVLYPIFAARYLQIPIAETLLSIDKGYSKTASIAAMMWLQKTLGTDFDTIHHDGITFQTEVAGQMRTFCFPALCFQVGQKHATMIPICDCRDNEDSWSGGATPQYAREISKLTLWCWRKAMEANIVSECPSDCYIVRITGNTPGDIMVRTIHGDDALEDTTALQCCIRFSQRCSHGENPVEPKIRKQASYFEIKQQEMEDALCIDNADAYKLVKDYMTVKTLRKDAEVTEKELKEKMDSLAVYLASQLPPQAVSGELTVGDTVYSVTHNMSKGRGSISAELLRQFYPEYIDCISSNIVTRGRINIEAY